ncbi:hypothetical protein CCP3SC1AL1_320026 [Gammaproteobacteria bacterium]
MSNNVKLEDYEGTNIEKSFKQNKFKSNFAKSESGDWFYKGKKCSMKKKECVDKVMAEGKDESSAYAICTESVGK